MTRYTVIGAGGFIGSRLVAALTARGEEVHGPARGDPGLFGRDLGRVFYCAGLTGDFMIRPFDTVEAHVGLLTQLLRDASFERLIYLSSTRVYDSLGARGGKESDILEFDVAAPRNVYDLSKALGENLCLARSGGRAAVARLANVFDWTDDAGGFLSDLLKRARREKVMTLDSSPLAGRDYIHADDVIAALLAMDAQDTDGIVNVARGEAISNGDVAAVLAQAGWTLNLTGQGAPHGPVCDVARLHGLGVAPRDVRAVIAGALSDPGFFIG
ncbi:SDR family oxidoreductase [Phenylobacterium sp.]|uniref:NAD-dependent epimerase/dehydratase family protein n=1 Tax=Phenylobacterium sp. TaxID=1871053 RepID=UPI0028A0996F|nr:SDR family oxidoreductase [Phenylobacterium sp.]